MVPIYSFIIYTVCTCYVLGTEDNTVSKMDGVVAIRNLIILSCIHFFIKCLLSAYDISYQCWPQLSTNLDYGIRIVEQIGPIPSLCYNGWKEIYQIIRNAMQIIKIAWCSKDRLWLYRRGGQGRLWSEWYQRGSYMMIRDKGILYTEKSIPDKGKN